MRGNGTATGSTRLLHVHASLVFLACDMMMSARVYATALALAVALVANASIRNTPEKQFWERKNLKEKALREDPWKGGQTFCVDLLLC